MRHDWYTASAEELFANLWLNNAMKVALLNPAYVPNRDVHKRWTDVAANEVTGTLYTAGGILLSGKSAPYDAAQDRTDFRCADVTWGPGATFSAGFAAIYDSSGTQPLWSLIDFEGEKDVANGVFTIDFATIGALAILPGPVVTLAVV